MSSTTPAELNASTIIERIESGAYPREVLETIAAGFLPLPQEDLVAVLAYLTVTGDSGIAATARKSLGDVPPRTILAVASSETAAGGHLAYLAGATDDPAVLEALIRNRALPDDAVVRLAGSADAHLQEVIVINQARILRAPGILDALLANPLLSPETRRRAVETREEFFEKRARLREVDAEADLTLPDDEISDLLEKAPDDDANASPPPLAPLPEHDSQQTSILSLILKMSTKEKVQLAFRCGKTPRMILIRDRNKLVCTAVMRNPRVTETEVESIAGLRNVDEEVLRIIGKHRQWMSKQPIMSALVHNPKAPVGVVLPLINRLTLRDLKSLKDDKGVAEVVRALARKLFNQRNQQA
jgi:hypothetical protein